MALIVGGNFGIVYWDIVLSVSGTQLGRILIFWLFQLLKIKPAEQGQEYVEMTFVEHKACECR